MLNLVDNPWIPVVRSGGADVIRPDQIAEPDVLRLDWPRPDLDLACMEMLVGLVYLACPPEGTAARANPPDAPALRAALAPLAPAFNLLGEGPRFMQDLEPLEEAEKPADINPPDMLFLDGAGDSTIRKNADLMVKRGRYEGLALPLAAMALYTLQDFAPSGGAGNRTSMRGGGPLVTLVAPRGAGLWETIWANVPEGAPLGGDELEALPWMRPTITSEKGSGRLRTPMEGNSIEPETFFGMPRRLRLIEEGGMVTGVVQRPWGTNYEGWTHPLSPYYRDNKGQWLPMHPKLGHFGYRNWRGVLFKTENAMRAAVVERWIGENPGARCNLIVGGWAMDNMKPVDFVWSEPPLFALDPEAETEAERMVEAAEQAAFALFASVKEGGEESDALIAREALFDATEAAFVARVAGLCAGNPPDARGWVGELRGAALTLFDRAVMPNLPDLGESRRVAAVKARGKLLGAFSGYPPFGKKIFGPLGLELPAKKAARKARRKESA